MSAKRSQARRTGSQSKQSVRNRGLLVLTLILVGSFGAGLAYIKKNAQTTPSAAVASTPAVNQVATAEPAVAQPSMLQSVKPKYDFYNELPKRQVVINNDEIERRPQRQTKPEPQAKPKTETTTQQAQRQTQQQARQQPTTTAVKMPKIELISRQSRSTSSNTSKRAEKIASAGARWTIQAGAYSKFADAERIRAKLGRLGIQARIEAGTSNNKQIHRVRIGPILSKSNADSLNQRLSRNNIPSLLIKSN